jgi:hypothetical protein
MPLRRYFLPGDRNRAVGDKTDVLLRRPGIGFPASGGPLFDAGIVVEDRDSLMVHLPNYKPLIHGLTRDIPMHRQIRQLSSLNPCYIRHG